MWDNTTESLWQQVTGEGIVGELAGRQLAPIGAAIVRWADFKTDNPGGEAMSTDQGLGITYGGNPYAFYSSRSAPYSFFSGEIDDRYPALERVLGLTIGDKTKAYPFPDLAKVGVANDVVGGMPVVVFWGAPDTADALDASIIAESVGVGSALAFSPIVRGETLTFNAISDTEFEDTETGSTWSILGRAHSGELVGSQLEILPHRNEFWFAWQAFFPDGEVWAG
jgi:hypothetical protein